MTTSPFSFRNYLGRATIVVWVLLMHIVALKIVDTIDRKSVPLELQGAKSLQVVFVQTLSPAPLSNSVGSVTKERHLPMTTTKPLTRHRTIRTIQRPHKTPMEQINTLANSPKNPQDEAKTTASSESKDDAIEVKAAPLNLRLPRASANSTMDEQRILREASTKKSANQVFADDMERALRTDCRSAHAGGGLLAVPRLLTDAITGHGCKW